MPCDEDLMILALSVIACGWSRLPSSELRSCITIANKTGGLSRQTSRSRDSVCEWFDLRANRLDLAKGMIMAFHISFAYMIELKFILVDMISKGIATHLSMI